MTSESVPRRVLKLGGSLLALPDWPDRLRRWLAAQEPCQDILVVGGGRLADAVRELARDGRVDDVEAHWMSIAAMTINADRVAEALAITTSTARRVREGSRTPGLVVLDAWRFLRDEEPTLVDEPLPVGWHVTSDSIAARAAEVLDAEALVLFKSCLPTSEQVAILAERGYVDAYFPKASAKIAHVVFVDLRADDGDDRGR